MVAGRSSLWKTMRTGINRRGTDLGFAPGKPDLDSDCQRRRRNQPQEPSRTDGNVEPQPPSHQFPFFRWEFFSGPRISNSQLCSRNFLKAFLCPIRAPIFQFLWNVLSYKRYFSCLNVYTTELVKKGKMREAHEGLLLYFSLDSNGLTTSLKQSNKNI